MYNEYKCIIFGVDTFYIRIVFSLFDLAKFIQDADGGLMKPVVEGDYEVLVSVMGYLYNVKERQATTDKMFQPLTDTIQLLKYYDMELSEEVNVLLQVLSIKYALFIFLLKQK